MQKTTKLVKIAVCIMMVLAVAVAYAPVNCDTASAAMKTTDRVKSLRCVKTRATSVTLLWDKYSGADGYQIYKKSSENGEYSWIKTTSKKYFRRRNLTTNKTCWYKVRAYAVDSSGNKSYSKFSYTIKATPELSKPIVKTSSSKSYIKVSWTAVEEATGYQIYRSSSLNGSYKHIASTYKKTIKNTKDVDPGQVYYYKVRAYKTIDGKHKHGDFSYKVSGKTTTQASTVAATTTKSTSTTATTKSNTTATTKATSTTTTTSAVKLTAPGKPSSVSIKGYSGYAKVSWKSVSDATGYQVERATSSTGSYTILGKTTNLYYNDKSVSSGKTYYYKVRAYKSASGQTVYGSWTSNKYSRAVMVSNAVAWYGCKESNGSHKKIIDVYNNNRGSGYKMSYSDPWCATFVSAVGIKSGYTSIIHIGTYCPSMMAAYKSDGNYTSNKKYIPSAGDIVFYDWNYNGVPDHVGMVVSATSSTIKVIEGNKNDAVDYRTYSPGYGYLCSYGLPKYSSSCGIKYNGTSSTSAVGAAAAEELSSVGISSSEPEGYDDINSEYNNVQKKVFDGVGCGEETSEYDKMLYMIKKVKSEANTDDIDCSESEYYAAFIYKLCQEADMNASIVTVKGDDDSDTQAWVEVSLDDTMYKVDASEENAKPEKYTPETTDCNPDEQ